MKRILLFTILIFPCLSLAAQNGSSAGKDGRVTFDMTLKNKFEYDFIAEQMRFEVRNSRLGLKGNLNDNISFRTQVELSNSGKFEVLDIFGTFRFDNGLRISFGQQPVSLYNDYMTGPNQMMFANRTFSAKYITSTRDIGVMAFYGFEAGGVPFQVEAGVFNGGKINQPVWTDRPGYSARLIAGSNEGWRSSIKYYRYPYSTTSDFVMWGADFRYAARRIRLEGEAINRNNVATGDVMFSPSLQGAYSFPLKNSKIFKNITPALRWDSMGYDFIKRGSDVNRVTVGVALGLVEKSFSSLLRLDYENYLVRSDIPELHLNGENENDKITLELVIVF